MARMSDGNGTVEMTLHICASLRKKFGAISVLLVACVMSTPGQSFVSAQAAAPPLRISLDANPKANSNYGRAARTEAIRLLAATGATHFHFSLTWPEIERRPGIFSVGDARLTLLSAQPLPVAFTLKIIDAGARQMPDEYRHLAWDSPVMIERVTMLIDQLAPVLGPRPWSYAIGNEIELYFARHPEEIGAFARLLAHLRPVVGARHPAASFTTVWQLSASPHIKTAFAPVFAVLDHVALTYYPLAADLSVRAPDVVFHDLQLALEHSAPLPIALQEIGYPSASRLGSSEEQQREFMRHAFNAVSAAGPERVLGMTYLFQSDPPQWLVNTFVAAYQFDTENFRAFLSTLGLRDDRDRPKPGWDEFVRQAGEVRNANRNR